VIDNPTPPDTDERFGDRVDRIVQDYDEMRRIVWAAAEEDPANFFAAVTSGAMEAWDDETNPLVLYLRECVNNTVEGESRDWPRWRGSMQATYPGRY
jgi:hypothetical protein